MTFKRALYWFAGGLVLCGSVLGVVRAVTFSVGVPVAGPALIDGPRVQDWALDDPAFGGLSALLVEGNRLITGSDKGHVFQAQITRDAAGWITALEVVQSVFLTSMDGVDVDEFKSDLEGLTRHPDGPLMLSFEGYTRIQILPDFGANLVPTHGWSLFEDYFGNRSFEALATLPDGRILAVIEGYGSDGMAQTFQRIGTEWEDGPFMPLADGFVIVGADVGPDQCLYLLDRKYTLAGGFAHRVRRTASLAEIGEVIYTSAPAALGNAEGISVQEASGGTIMATVITDNNFLPGAPTRLIEYRIEANMRCDGAL